MMDHLWLVFRIVYYQPFGLVFPPLQSSFGHPLWAERHPALGVGVDEKRFAVDGVAGGKKGLGDVVSRVEGQSFFLPVLLVLWHFVADTDLVSVPTAACIGKIQCFGEIRVQHRFIIDAERMYIPWPCGFVVLKSRALPKTLTIPR